MSHVDEGELTAYADGAYPADSADAQRIDAHLALCVNCRNRVELALALTGRASEILAAAAPIDITMPDFADVRAAAATVQRHRRAVPLTWAASVILALGLGWFGRGALFEPAPQRAVLSTTANARAPADMTAAAPQPAAPVPELRQADAIGAARGRSAPAMAPERDQVQAANSIERATTTAAAAEAAPSVAEKAVAQGETRAVAGQAAGVVAADIDYMTAAEAERRGVALHVIPELEVVRVGVRSNEVVVEQKLPDGKLINITASQPVQPLADASIRREAAVPAAPPAARARADEAFRKVAAPVVEITRGETRLRISATLSEDSLRALVAKIR